MAKSAKEGAGTGGVIKTIPQAELRKLIREATAAKAAASEASGEHGSIVKNACERFNIEKKAFSFIRGLNEMESPKRLAVFRQIIDFGGKLGHFDQIDAFDDIVPMLEQLLSDLKAKQPKAAKDDTPRGSAKKKESEPPTGGDKPGADGKPAGAPLQ